MTQITGIFNILATPFDAAQAIDLDSLRRLVDFQVDKSAYGLTILGVLGEAAKLSVEERQQVLQTVMATVSGRVPVIVGTSHQDIETSLALSKAAIAAGAAGVMIAPPRMSNPTDDAVIAIYQRAAEVIADAAIVVQDFPPVNGITMSPEMLRRLADLVPTARYLKLEDPPLMEKISAIRAATDKFEIFGGLGGMFLLEELKRGAAGTMTGFAFTEILVEVYQAFHSHDPGRAELIFDQYLPLIRFENQPVINLTIRKQLLYRRGAIAHATPRSPFPPIDAGTHAEIDWILQRVGISNPKQKVSFDHF